MKYWWNKRYLQGGDCHKFKVTKQKAKYHRNLKKKNLKCINFNAKSILVTITKIQDNNDERILLTLL